MGGSGSHTLRYPPDLTLRTPVWGMGAFKLDGQN
jgi:hypothetical protein